jgi:hypothetical protein
MELRNGKQYMPYRQEENQEDCEEVEVTELYYSSKYTMVHDDFGNYIILSYDGDEEYEYPLKNWGNIAAYYEAKNKFIELTNNDYRARVNEAKNEFIIEVTNNDSMVSKKDFCEEDSEEEDSEEEEVNELMSSLKYTLYGDDSGIYYIDKKDDTDFYEYHCFNEAKNKFIELTNNDFTVCY